MFEALVQLCLLQSPDICRESLLAGYEAPSEAACLSSNPVVPGAFYDQYQVSEPLCAPIGAALELEKLDEGVYAHRGEISDATKRNEGDVSNSGFIIGEASIAVIDTGGSRKVAEALYRAIRSVSDLPISHVILTHMHPDHVLGASVFAELGASIVGHAGLERALQDRGRSYLQGFGRLVGKANFIGSRIVSPDIDVSAAHEINLGGRILMLYSWPQSHTSTDVTVFDESSGIFFAGDLVFDRHAPALDGSLRGWQSVLKELKENGARYVVPGHGGLLMEWPAASEPLETYLGVLARDTRKALDEGATLGASVEVIAQSQSEHWELFDLFNPRNATVAFTELEWE